LILTAMAFAFIFVVALYSTIVIIHCNIRAEMGASGWNLTLGAHA